MARFELNIYGEDDEIIKKYGTDHIRYGVLMRAVELYEGTERKGRGDQIKAANAIVKQVFGGLTDEELMQADVDDVLATFGQVISQVTGIGGSDAKN